MIQIEETVHRIAKLPGAMVDRGFGQGREVVREQYETLLGEEVSDLYLEGKYISYRDAMDEIQTWVYPYTLPEDYLFFLEFYGGLVIRTEAYTLVVDGNGPMCEEWYSYLRGEEPETQPSRDGLLQIGRLQFRDTSGNFPFTLFFLDLAGVFQPNSIIGIGPWKAHDPDTAQIIAHPSIYHSMWRILANSFTAWLEFAAETHGTFGYTLDI